ncbi:putative leader peptide [Streptomyces sp. NPDC048324]
MHARGAAPHGACTGAHLVARRHVDFCRTSSAVCPSTLI